MMNDIRSRLLASTLLFGSVAAAQPAVAQTIPVENVQQGDTAQEEASTGGQDIIVTGSRITNPNLVQSSPVAAITSEEINLRQPQNAEEFLRQLPGTVPGVGTQVNNGANGSATTNLRGLGVNRNLVLLNGRRIVPAQLTWWWIPTSSPSRSSTASTCSPAAHRASMVPMRWRASSTS